MTVEKLNALNILLGDDESKALETLGRQIAAKERAWSIRIARNGAAAIAAAQQGKVDVVITDIRAVQSLGAEFLAILKRDHPSVLRLLIHDEGDAEALRKATGLAHRYVSKPVTADALVVAIKQVYLTQNLINQPAVSSIVLETKQLHINNQPLQELLATADDPTIDIDRLAAIIAKHPTAVASILQVANTAFFGAGGRVETLKDALQLLGMDFVRSLAITELAKKQLNLTPGLQEIANGVLQHCIETSGYGFQMRSFVKNLKLIQQLTSIALLHDLGKLVLLAKEGERYADLLGRSLESDVPCWKIEQASLGADHASVGAYLFNLWGMPEGIVRAVAWHHRPSEICAAEFCPTSLVHMANYAAHAKRDMPYYRGDDLDTGLAAKLGVQPEFPRDLE